MITINKFGVMKTLLVFIAYFAYTMVINCILGVFGINDPIQVSFVADILFAFVIIFIYRNVISKSFSDFRKSNSFFKRFMIVLFSVIVLFIINILGGVCGEILFSNMNDVDQNTTMIYELANMSTVYMIFKTLIFASVVENIVFRVSIRELTTNNIMFVVSSSLIYALVNVMYSEFSMFIFVDMIQYFLISMFLSLIYIKNKNSIYPVMLVLFFYNLIPLTILLFGIGAW